MRQPTLFPTAPVRLSPTEVREVVAQRLQGLEWRQRIREEKRARAARRRRRRVQEVSQ